MNWFYWRFLLTNFGSWLIRCLARNSKLSSLGMVVTGSDIITPPRGGKYPPPLQLRDNTTRIFVICSVFLLFCIVNLPFPLVYTPETNFMPPPNFKFLEINLITGLCWSLSKVIIKFVSLVFWTFIIVLYPVRKERSL